MKRIGLVLAIIIAGAAILWLAGMSITNSRLTRLEVRLTGSMDEVSFFRSADLSSPVAVIQTHGMDTTQVVELRSSQYFSPFFQAPPASYTFAMRIGDSVYPGRKICCENGLFAHRFLLTISGPAAWQIVDK